MNPTPNLRNTAKAKLASELADLVMRVEVMRAELGQPKPGGATAIDEGARLAAELVEVNERLVLSALQAHSEVASAQIALDDAAQAADIDALTALPNRTLLLHRFAQAIASAKRHASRIAVLFLDLNGFKQINDRLGHAVGDEVLKLAARCFASVVRDADTAGRYGGDEFLILLPDISQIADAGLIAGKINAALAAVDSPGRQLPTLTVSIGISIYPDDATDAATLIDLADAAMYRAKRHGSASFAFHGQEPAGGRRRSGPGAGSSRTFAPHPEPVQGLHVQRYADLRDANEQLLLAVLDARALQAAAEKSQQRQAEFLILLARALRDPLAPIAAAVARVVRVRPEELPRIQAIIERQVTRMTRLVGDLHDVSRLKTDTLRLDRKCIDMTALLDEAIDACRPAMDSRQQRLTIDRPARALMIDGDPVRLAQVLGNLLDNASRYTPTGGSIDLSVVVTGLDLVITVADTGLGIAAAVLPRIFEPFTQGKHAVSIHGGDGTGIGLTVVRELVHAHGGSVAASSAGSGKGSQFVVTLPLA